MSSYTLLYLRELGNILKIHVLPDYPCKYHDLIPRVSMDTLETHSAGKKLTYDNTEDEEESHDEQCKRPKITRMKRTANSIEEQSAVDLPSKRQSPLYSLLSFFYIDLLNAAKQMVKKAQNLLLRDRQSLISRITKLSIIVNCVCLL